jgi:L-iditol 2-dehydrogenase
MSTIQAAVLRGVGDLVIEERPAPEAGPHEVLVRVDAVGVCGSDVHYFQHGRIGQRVSMEPGVPDLTCRQCLAGRYNLRPHMQFFATPPVDGSLAEVVTLHEAFAHPVPDNLSDDAAALLEPLSVGVWANRKAATGPGSRVLVTGAGAVGLVAAQVALACGATEVAVSDVNAHRLELARSLGVTATLDPRTDAVADSGFQPDVLLECSGHPGATTAALRGPGPGRPCRPRGYGWRRAGPSARHPAEPRAHRDRHLPLRQHLAHGDRPGRLRAGEPGCPGDRTLPAVPLGGGSAGRRTRPAGREVGRQPAALAAHHDRDADQWPKSVADEDLAPPGGQEDCTSVVPSESKE